ncbi:MAG: hypothetical protein KKA19_05280, partial [Candidatus Margulisbacteria bacterium]|nr:hypothetical protein [Candidatus Margulisiibacteriota bacterium]
PFQIFAILTFFLWGSISFVVCYLVPTQDTQNRKFWGTFAIIILFFVNLLLISPVSSTLEKWSQKKAWQGYSIIKTIESPYGRLTLTQEHRELAVYNNSELLFSTTERPLNEENIHTPLLTKISPPKNILMIGGGLGGALEEILKYSSVESIDYIETDRTLLRYSREYLSRFNFFRDKRVQILSKDARQYLNTVSKNYDVIISGLSAPETLMFNRFYSLEFFQLCKNHLTSDGIMAFTMPYAESYMGKAMLEFNQLIAKSFQAVFPTVIIWPGTLNHFIGTASEIPFSTNSWNLVAKMNERGIRNGYFTPEALTNLFTPEKVENAQGLLTGENALPFNNDLKPYAYFYYQILWSTYIKSPLNNIFSKTNHIILYAIFAFFIIYLIYHRLTSSQKNTFIPLAIFSLGASSMILQIATIFLFQILVGSLYYQIGILILFFMLGLYFGSYQSRKEFVLGKNIKNNLHLEMLLLFIPVIILSGLTIFSITMLPSWLYIIAIPLISYLIGYPVGRTFGIGLRYQYKYIAQPGFLAAIIYSFDIWGGALTALVTTVLLLPLIGFIGTIAIASGFLISAIFLAK